MAQSKARQRCRRNGCGHAWSNHGTDGCLFRNLDPNRCGCTAYMATKAPSVPQDAQREAQGYPPIAAPAGAAPAQGESPLVSGEYVLCTECGAPQWVAVHDADPAFGHPCHLPTDCDHGISKTGRMAWKCDVCGQFAGWNDWAWNSTLKDLRDAQERAERAEAELAALRAPASAPAATVAVAEIEAVVSQWRDQVDAERSCEPEPGIDWNSEVIRAASRLRLEACASELAALLPSASTDAPRLNPYGAGRICGDCGASEFVITHMPGRGHPFAPATTGGDGDDNG